MKKYRYAPFPTFLFLCLFSPKVFGQQAPIIHSWYITKDPTIVLSPDKTQRYTVPAGVKFHVDDVSADNFYQITFANYPETFVTANGEKGNTAIPTEDVRFARIKKSVLNDYPADLAYIDSWANLKPFIISPTQLNNCALYYTRKFEFTFGALTLPLKIRFGDSKEVYSSFEESLNLGLSVGTKWTIPSSINQSVSALAFLSKSSVTLDAQSVEDPSFFDPKNPTSGALSYGIGTVYQNGTFQIGLFGGIDHISGPLGRQWRLQDRPWLGIGIGFAIFTVQSQQGGTPPSNDSK